MVKKKIEEVKVGISFATLNGGSICVDQALVSMSISSSARMYEPLT